MSIPLYDDFDNQFGQFANYDTFDTGQAAQLPKQKHVDIRSFVQSNAYPGGPQGENWSLAPYTMTVLDGPPGFNMTALDLLTITTLENSGGTSLGTIQPQADRHNFYGLSLNCTPTGANTTTSITVPVSLAGFLGTDYISLALPAFPLASVNLANTFIDFSSDDFGAQTDSFAFSTSTTTLIAGDCEARFPISMFANINPVKLTGVRFRIQVTGACVFRCLAIRCLSTTWESAPLDQNTLYGRLAASVPPTGTATPSYAFPTAAGPVTPSDWPILLFSDGDIGPRLVNVDVGVIIETGLNSAANKFSLYFREMEMIPESVSSLDSMTITALEALGQQPDYTPGVLNTFSEAYFLVVTMNWGTSGSITIDDQLGTGYSFTGLTFATGSSYYLRVQLADQSIRAQVYPIDSIGVIDWSTIVFDSTAIIDSSFVSRRRGRLGWYAQLNEGDTFVRALRPRRTVYGEYRSAPLQSMTPVEGARLYVSSTPDMELYTGAVATPGVVLSPDVTKSTTGQCIKVQTDGSAANQGLVANPIRFENLYDTEVEFDVLAPFSVALSATLVGEGRTIPLYLPTLSTNLWTHMKLPLELAGNLYQPGPYSLYLVQTETGVNTWYVDNLSVHTKSVSWQGRGQAADPWNMNVQPWVKFGDAINDPYDGVLFGRGNALQVRGQAVTPDATLGDLKILPKYSEFGNFVWGDQAPSYGSAPVSSFTTTTVGSPPHSVSFNGSASTASNGIAEYYWTFGDGSYAYGQTVTHTYVAPATYVVNLTVIDTLDQETSTIHTVTVS